MSKRISVIISDEEHAALAKHAFEHRDSMSGLLAKSARALCQGAFTFSGWDVVLPDAKVLPVSSPRTKEEAPVIEEDPEDALDYVPAPVPGADGKPYVDPQFRGTVITREQYKDFIQRWQGTGYPDTDVMHFMDYKNGFLARTGVSQYSFKWMSEHYPFSRLDPNYPKTVKFLGLEG